MLKRLIFVVGAILVISLGIIVVSRFSRSMVSESSKLNGEGSNGRVSLPSAVTISKQTVELKVGQIETVVITNIGDILGCDKHNKYIGAQTLEVKLSRGDSNRIASSIWSHRGDMTLLVNGFDDISRIKRLPITASGIVPASSDPARDGKIVIISLNRHGQPANLLIKVSDRTKVIEMESDGGFAGNNVVVKDYPIAVAEKMTRDNQNRLHIVGFYIIDLRSLDLLGEVPLSDALNIEGISFVLDSKSNALIAVEIGLNWLMIMDLSKVSNSNEVKATDTHPE